MTNDEIAEFIDGLPWQYRKTSQSDALTAFLIKCNCEAATKAITDMVTDYTATKKPAVGQLIESLSRRMGWTKAEGKAKDEEPYIDPKITRMSFHFFAQVFLATTNAAKTDALREFFNGRLEAGDPIGDDEMSDLYDFLEGQREKARYMDKHSGKGEAPPPLAVKTISTKLAEELKPPDEEFPMP